MIILRCNVSPYRATSIMYKNFPENEKSKKQISQKFSVREETLVCSSRGGVEDTRLEAKDTKKIQGQGQPFRGQTLSRPRTGMLEAKDQGHRCKCSPKKEIFKHFFRRSPKKKGLQKFISRDLQNFNNSKNTAILEPRTGQFSRT